MLHTLTRIRGAKVRATDGEAGHVEEFVFDDDTWTIRYLVVNTETWLNRRVLISPMSIERQWTVAELPTRLTKEQLRTSPIIESPKTPSRHHEAQLLEHYGHPFYWENSAIGTDGPDQRHVKPGDDRLCGLREVTGFHIQAVDCEIGHVDDFIIDDNSWRIEYLLIDTSSWMETKSILVPPAALRGVDWSNSRMRVALTQDAVRRSPFSDSTPVASGEDPLVEWVM